MYSRLENPVKIYRNTRFQNIRRLWYVRREIFVLNSVRLSIVKITVIGRRYNAQSIYVLEWLVISPVDRFGQRIKQYKYVRTNMQQVC